MNYEEQIIELLCTSEFANIELAKSLCESQNIDIIQLLKSHQYHRIGLGQPSNFVNVQRLYINDQHNFIVPKLLPRSATLLHIGGSNGVYFQHEFTPSIIRIENCNGVAFFKPFAEGLHILKVGNMMSDKEVRNVYIEGALPKSIKHLSFIKAKNITIQKNQHLPNLWGLTFINCTKLKEYTHLIQEGITNMDITGCYIGNTDINFPKSLLNLTLVRCKYKNTLQIPKGLKECTTAYNIIY